jgi:hypothetical protein
VCGGVHDRRPGSVSRVTPRVVAPAACLRLGQAHACVLRSCVTLAGCSMPASAQKGIMVSVLVHEDCEGLCPGTGVHASCGDMPSAFIVPGWHQPLGWNRRRRHGDAPLILLRSCTMGTPWPSPAAAAVCRSGVAAVTLALAPQGFARTRYITPLASSDINSASSWPRPVRTGRAIWVVPPVRNPDAGASFWGCPSLTPD